MDHLISADESEDTEIVNSWLNWTMSLSQLFNHNDNEQLTAMIMDLRKHINCNFDTSQLLKWLDTVQEPFSADYWQFSSPVAMFGVAFLIAVVSFAVWKKCCAQASHTAHTPRIATQLPPPQHQPQTQPQPQPQPQMQPPLAPAPSTPAYAQQNPTFNF
jgi:hypothetical protein